MKRPGTRRPILAIAALVLAAAGTVGCRRGAAPTRPPDYRELEVGLSVAERAELRFLSEGSDLVPVDLLRALVDPATGRPFAESMERYGFLPAAASERNPYGLPIGWTTNAPDLSPNRLPYVGINCAACHTGRIDHGGEALLIDGAPNMADVERLGLAVRDAVLATLNDPAATVELVGRLARLRHPRDGAAAILRLPSDARKFVDNLKRSVDRRSSGEGGNEVAAALRDLLRGESDEQALRRLGSAVAEHQRERAAATFEILARYAPVVRDRAELALRAVRAIERSPAAGPGRDDPWGLVRNVVFAQDVPLDAPTSIPALFHVGDFDWYHADGNTTSILQRDVTQAVALGAYVDPTAGESTLLPRNIHRLETLWSRVESPAWPEEVLGAIDRALAARGEVLFRRKLERPGGVAFSCADCHGSRRAMLAPLDEVGTDPNRALSFAAPLDGEPFAERIPAALSTVIAAAIARAGVSAAEAASFEPREPRWRTTRRYVARRLDGVWATAPYLHNGSVPTLHDLLLPPDRRPAEFHLGHRDYDPERVGYATEVERPVFVFDVTVAGNSNAGHDYGTRLDEADRAALIEYLKTL